MLSRQVKRWSAFILLVFITCLFGSAGLSYAAASSTITAPSNGTVLAGDMYTITGKAASDTGPVIKVEVSVDGGNTWIPAADASGDGSFSSWSYGFRLPAGGSLSLMSRATDNDGQVEAPGAKVAVKVNNTASQ